MEQGKAIMMQQQHQLLSENSKVGKKSTAIKEKYRCVRLALSHFISLIILQASTNPFIHSIVFL
jgi:hypothetical protein